MTGQEVTLATGLSIGPTFTGTVREWYETLIETIIDVGNHMHKKYGTKPNKILVDEQSRSLIECSVIYRPARTDYCMHLGDICRMKVFDKKKLGWTIQVCLDLGDVRHVGSVKVLDAELI